MLDLEKIKKLHDKAYQSGQVTRERAADDLVFYWVTHWDDAILDETQLAYRGEFDILRKAGRNILADLEKNPIQVDFEPVDDDREDAAEILDGMYRNDNRSNTSIEAFTNADIENVVCGVGAWKLEPEYVTLRSGDVNQFIKRKPIYEANNTVFWDPNAKLLDKSDANYVGVLFSYSEDGYKELVNELTGEDIDEINPKNFSSPEQSLTFPWLLGEAKKYHVVEFYHRKKVMKSIFFMVDPFGSEITVSEDQMEKIEDDLMEQGYFIMGEKKVERWEVTKYIASGEKILSEDIIAGEHIPIIPVYGERAFIEGEEHYEGVTRLAKDPQRLRDFQMSYLADIASKSPREKPIFTPEQIAGHEDMYSLSGADNNYPYLLQNRFDAEGNELPLGALATLPAPNIPPALAAVLELSRQAVEDVANPGLPQDIADPDLSGKAILALQARMDMQSMVYQKHRKHAQRRDGEVYASMASVIYDVPRKVKIQLPDGTVKTEEIMQEVIDEQTGEIVTLKDLREVEFNVYSEITSDYSSQKEQTMDRLDKMLEVLPPGDPLRNIIMLKQLKLMDGVDFDDVREYARNQLILMGIEKPETEEEIQMAQQAAQSGEEPSAEMVLAQAEMLKGQADMLREKREITKMQLEYQVKTTKNEIDAFEAQTDRFESQIAAQEAGVKIDKTAAEALGQKLENQAKVVQLRDPANMSTDEIYAELMATG